MSHNSHSPQRSDKHQHVLFWSFGANYWCWNTVWRALERTHHGGWEQLLKSVQTKEYWRKHGDIVQIIGPRTWAESKTKLKGFDLNLRTNISWNIASERLLYESNMRFPLCLSASLPHTASGLHGSAGPICCLRLAWKAGGQLLMPPSFGPPFISAHPFSTRWSKATWLLNIQAHTYAWRGSTVSADTH